MEKIKKDFVLKINGEEVFSIEAMGTEEIIESFNKEVFGTFGIFREIKEKLANIVLNGIELKMQTVFRDKKGKFVDIKKVIASKKK